MQQYPQEKKTLGQMFMNIQFKDCFLVKHLNYMN